MSLKSLKLIAAEFKNIKGSDVRILGKMYKKGPGRAKIKGYINNEINYHGFN